MDDVNCRAERDLKIACIIMAAGRSIRFGDNKLTRNMGDRRLFEYALDAADVFTPANCVAVVSGNRLILDMAEKRGYLPILNAVPELGTSHTIALGLDAAMDKHKSVDAIMFMVADQPFLRSATIRAMCEYWRSNGGIVALSHNYRRGNPVIFPSSLFGELRALAGDGGGSEVIRNNEDKLKLYETEAAELMDIDTVADMEYAVGLNAERLKR